MSITSKSEKGMTHNEHFVLIIGFGKIGQLKAPIWNSQGYNIAIYDTDPRKKALILKLGYMHIKNLTDTPANTAIVDISTPAGTHGIVLREALNNLRNKPKAILIEKPLASSRAELQEITHILNDPQLSPIVDTVFANEQYYASKTLARARQIIKTEKICSVRVNLSKNRLSDSLENGRFFDYSLGAFGIELPHAIAAIDILGMNIDGLSTAKSVRYLDESNFLNQGVSINANLEGVDVVLESYLGDFTVVEDRLISKNEIVRSILIETDLKHITLTLDPHPSLERFFTNIEVRSKDGKLYTEVLFDDHLAESLRQFAPNAINPSEKIKVQNIIPQVEYIFRLHENALTHTLKQRALTKKED